jgi:DNA-binding CsgD family transcriptional regulator
VPGAYVGRERERAAGAELLDQARAGVSRALLISGEPGAGKTSLLGEVVDEARRAGFLAVEAAADVADAGVPYAALRLALEPALEAVSAPALTDVARSLGAALVAAGDGSSRPTANGQVPELLRQALAGWAARQPVILTIDDLHTADADTVSTLLYVIRHLRRDRVLVAATTRIDAPDLDAERADMFERLRDSGAIDVVNLGALDDRELGLLVAARTGDPPDPSLLATLVERTGGNPFFAVELLGALDASGALRRRDGAVGVSPTAEPTLPRRVTTAVLHRVFQLGPDARAVASTASLFTALPLHRLPLLATLSGLGPTRCATAFDRLVSARILVGEGDRYHFTHAIVRDALYEDLGPATRQRLHERAAMLLSEGNVGGAADVLEIASHVRRSAMRPDPRAAGLLAAAGDLMVTRAPRSAVGWYRDALARLAPRDRAAARIEIELGRALTFSGQHGEAAQVAIDAASALAPGPDRGRAVIVGARALFAAGRVDDAAAVLDAALADPMQRSARLLQHRAQVHLWQGRLEEARRLVAEATTVDPAEGRSMADAVSMHLAASAGDYARAAEFAGSLRAELDWLSPAAQINVQMSLCAVTALNGEARQAVADAENVERQGAMSPWFRACGAWALYRLGRWDDAVRSAESARDEVDVATGDLATAVFGPVLVAIHAERGDFAAAHSAAELSTQPGGALFDAGVDWARAMLLSTRGDHNGALEILDAAARRQGERGRLNHLALVLAQHAEVAWRVGNHAAARRTDDRLWALPRDDAGLAATLWCLLTRALVRRDADAAAAARALAVEHELAADAGRALGLLGAIRDDPAMLVEAYDELDRLGAVQRQRELSHHLRRLGKRAPRRKRSANRLTPTEAQIANLVSAGLTNRQVAGEARLSPKTVEVYLSRIYAKTGCRSRIELAVALNTGQVHAAAVDRV